MTATSKPPFNPILIGLLLLFLLLCVTGCASTSSAPPIEPVPCVHPKISVGTNAGLADGIRLYHDALDLCNALNGHGVPNEATRSPR